MLGTYNYKSGFFRHSWSNKFITKKLSVLSRKIKKYGKKYNTDIFDRELLEGHDWGRIITSVCIYLFDKPAYLVKNDHDNYPEAYIIIKRIIS